VVTDEEIEKQISELRARKGQRAEIGGRGIAEGDMAVVNIKPDGDSGEGKTFMIVVGQSFPTLDAILTGMGAEEIKHGKLSFPANFQEQDWAKKSFEATITVRSATATQTPELDDSFAQSLKANDVKDLKEKVKTGIERAKMQMGQEMINEQIFDQLLASSEVEVPDTTWEQVANQRLQEMAYELGREKKTVEDYAKENGMTTEELVKRQQDEARVHVKRAVLIETIFKQEKFEIDNELFVVSSPKGG
jgi:trigger factor